MKCIEMAISHLDVEGTGENTHRASYLYEISNVLTMFEYMPRAQIIQKTATTMQKSAAGPNTHGEWKTKKSSWSWLPHLMKTECFRCGWQYRDAMRNYVFLSMLRRSCTHTWNRNSKASMFQSHLLPVTVAGAKTHNTPKTFVTVDTNYAISI